MSSAPHRRGAVFAVLAVLAVIVHGSLWPYDFVARPGPVGPVDALILSIAGRPHFTDFLANVLLYSPLGVTLGLVLPGPRLGRFVLAVAAGTALSVSMELTQFWDAGRVTDFYDACSNATGTALGALAALLLGASARVPFLGRIAANPVPAMLLVAMLGYRLAPYVPAADIHKYWAAVKPLLDMRPPDALAAFRYAAIWLTASALLAEIVGARHSVLAAALLAGFVLLSKIAIIGSVLSWAELAGVAGALVVWLILHRAGRGRTVVVAAVLLIQIVIDRLQPFGFQAVARPFGWLPFRGFLLGSLSVNVASFFEKLFLYGTLFWLLAQAGLRRVAAAGLVAGVLLSTSFAETFLPDRSAEITDALMALISAGLIVWLDGQRVDSRPYPAPSGLITGRLRR